MVIFIETQMTVSKGENIMARTVKGDSAETKRITALAAIVAGSVNDEVDDPEEDDEITAHPAVKGTVFQKHKERKSQNRQRE